MFASSSLRPFILVLSVVLTGCGGVNNDSALPERQFTSARLVTLKSPSPEEWSKVSLLTYACPQGGACPSGPADRVIVLASQSYAPGTTHAADHDFLASPPTICLDGQYQCRLVLTHCTFSSREDRDRTRECFHGFDMPASVLRNSSCVRSNRENNSHEIDFNCVENQRTHKFK
jgi:hypothetical protein